jgi:hypothetical protein
VIPSSASATAFMVSLILYAYLLFLYWVKLNAFQTIGLFVPIGLLMAISGRHMLSGMHAKRS